MAFYTLCKVPMHKQMMHVMVPNVGSLVRQVCHKDVSLFDVLGST